MAKVLNTLGGFGSKANIRRYGKGETTVFSADKNYTSLRCPAHGLAIKKTE